MNLEKGDVALEDCEVACDACGKCAVDAPANVITMVDNLPIVNYEEDHNVRSAIERCPTGAIVWFDVEKGPVTGRLARRVIRQSARHVTPT
jgi:ferredoxin